VQGPLNTPLSTVHADHVNKEKKEDLKNLGYVVCDCRQLRGSSVPVWYAYIGPSSYCMVETGDG